MTPKSPDKHASGTTKPAKTPKTQARKGGDWEKTKAALRALLAVKPERRGR